MDYSKKKQLKERRIKSESVKKNIWKNNVLWFFRFFLGFGLAIPVLVGAYVLYNFFYVSDVFKITDIKIKGNNILTEKEIKNMIFIQNKERIYEFDINKISDNIKKISVVKNVVIKRSLPNKLLINIEERKPFAIFKYRKNFYEIDTDGVLMKEIILNAKNNNTQSENLKINSTLNTDGILMQEIEFSKEKKMPIISGIRKIESDIVLGTIPDSVKFKTALMILKEISISDIAMYFNIIKINAGNLRQIVLYTDKGVIIHLGNDKIKNKLKQLSILLAERKDEIISAKYVDLRFNSINIKPGK